MPGVQPSPLGPAPLTLGGRESSNPAAGLPASPRQIRATTTLAWLMRIYIVVAVGRISELVPGFGQIPFVKLIFLLTVISAIRYWKDLPSVTWKSIPPVKSTLYLMGIVTVSILFSVLRSETFGLITNFVTLVSITLLVSIKSSGRWTSVKTMLQGIVLAALVLIVAALRTNEAGRAGYSSNYDPNDFAFVMVGLFPVVVTFGVVSRGAKRLLYFGIALFLALAILLTQSRGGLLGLIFDIVAMTFLLPIAWRGRLHFRLSKPKLIARVVLLLLMGVAVWQSLPGSARARLETITALGSDYNAGDEGRFGIWGRNLPLVIRRPWGYGAGSFATVDGLFAGGRYRAPHNTFLQALVELGVAGFALFIAILVSTLRYLYVPADPELEEDSQGTPDEPRAFARGLAIGLIALCISGFFLSQLYAFVFWTFVTLGCAVGIARRARGGSRVSGGGMLQLGPNDVAVRPTSVASASPKRGSRGKSRMPLLKTGNPNSNGRPSGEP